MVNVESSDSACEEQIKNAHGNKKVHKEMSVY